LLYDAIRPEGNKKMKGFSNTSLMKTVVLAILILSAGHAQTKRQADVAPPEDTSRTTNPQPDIMMFTDPSRGRLFAKDPDVVNFKNKYYMYYTMCKFGDGRPGDGLALGIAESNDLTNWTKAGEILPKHEYEKNGLVAGAAIVIENKVHLFYSTYGNRKNDKICHAFSDDALNFTRNPSNPIFNPTGDWNCGRAIDSDIIAYRGKWFLYCATRDPDYKIQLITGAAAPLNCDFSRNCWTQIGSGPLLKPELHWEQTCIEAPTCCTHNGRLFMFYAGAYNNRPQQIGCAVSDDGINWERLFREPLLPNGKPGEWNSSESGHPGVFVDNDAKMHLFFQGNNDMGKSWYISKMKIEWKDNKPYLY